MEKEQVYANLAVIYEAVKSNKEILIDRSNGNILQAVSLKEWERVQDIERKDRTKFIISKTLGYCSSIFEENMEIRDGFFGNSQKIVVYFHKRKMGALAELVNELVIKEKERDVLYHDYHREQGS